MDILVLDFETTYSQSYSLSKLTTEQYIRDPQFETIGVAVKRNDEKTVWFSGDDEETKDFLDQYDWANSIAIAHNAIFDMAILNWRYDIRPKRIVDTLSMARALVIDDAFSEHGFGAPFFAAKAVQALYRSKAND